MVPVSVNSAPIYDEDGTIVGVSAAHRDVTQQRQAFEAAQYLAAIVESSDDAIFRRDLEGIITSWNPGAEKLFGYSRAEVVGTSADFLIPKDRRAEVKPVLAWIGTGHSVEHLETTRVRKDGTWAAVSVSVSPVCDADGAVAGVSVICRDVTQQREAFAAAQRMASIVQSSDDAIISGSPDGIILS